MAYRNDNMIQSTLNIMLVETHSNEVSKLFYKLKFGDIITLT